jgi:hypothetical protein
MIITVAVALVSAVALAVNNAKQAKIAEERDFMVDVHKNLLAENNVLNTCLETMEPEILSHKETLRQSAAEIQRLRNENEEKIRLEALVSKEKEEAEFWCKTAKELAIEKDIERQRVKALAEALAKAKKDSLAEELAQAKEEAKRLKETTEYLVYERDLHKKIRSQNFDERNAYKKMYEDLVKKNQ